MAFNLGVIDHGSAKLFCVDLAEFGKGANLGCSVLLMSIVQHVQIVGFLPPRLNLQSDNTSADYKNSVTFSTLGYLVSRGVFDEVCMRTISIPSTCSMCSCWCVSQ